MMTKSWTSVSNGGQFYVRLSLVEDVIDGPTSYCKRLYGRRAGKNGATRAMEAASFEAVP